MDAKDACPWEDQGDTMMVAVREETEMLKIIQHGDSIIN